MSQSFIPPTDGTLPSLVDFLDFNAKYNATYPYFIFPSLSDPEKLASLSFPDIAEASHRVAHFLRPNGQGKDGDVIGILLHTDTVLYVAIFLGALRAGLVPYPMSPRNSAPAVCHMLDATLCERIISQESLVPLVDQVRADREAKGQHLHVEEIPSLSVVFPTLASPQQNGGAPFQPYPTSERPVDVNSLSFYLHSSGSTGFPKSVPFTHHYILTFVNLNSLTGSRLRRLRYGSMGLPTFHAMGVVYHFWLPLTTGVATVVYAPQHPAPPTGPHPQRMYELTKQAGCNAISLVPSFLEAWARSEEIVQFMTILDLVTFGGGPLAQSVGDKLVSAGVRIRPAYGGTEFPGPIKIWPEPITPDFLPPIIPDEDWAWWEWSSRATTRMESQGDGTYELVLIETEQYALIMYNVPGEKAYATSDLFEPHPAKEGLWRIVGRKDDVITLSTGEKIVPLPQESHIGTSSLLLGCLMFGRGREQAGLLIEPAKEYAFDPIDETFLVQFRNKLWSIVEEANAAAPAFAKIFKEMIIVTDPSKPLPRAGKGTIQRKAATVAYAGEIDKLYETISESTNPQGISLPKSWRVDDLVPWLCAHAASVNNDQEPLPEADLFQQGFDSLSATFFRNRMIGALRASQDPRLKQAAQHVSPNLVFERPTVRGLASFLNGLADPVSGSQHQLAPSGIKATDIEALVRKYTSNMPSAKTRAHSAPPSPPVVLLTGSTGNIGSHILAYLLSNDRIARVYTLNRPSTSSPLERLEAAFSERALPEDILCHPKLSALVGDISQSKFGLEPAAYSEILASVTHIIHNAWTVNFNLPLQSYEDQIAGVRRLVDVCASTERPIKVLCTSSIGSTNLWDPSQGPVPERPLPDPAVATSTGYGASKYIVEQIMDRAAANGFGTTTVRMGQACGSKATGVWGTTEWMPIMVKSSASLGCFPEMTGPVNWVPLDAIGEAYIDWIVSQEELPLLVNVVHPHPTSWDVVLSGIRAELGGSLPIVTLQEWVANLEARLSTATADDLTKIPALKLLGFFRSLAASHSNGGDRADGLPFATEELQRSSPTMRKLLPLSEEHARMWVQYWKSRDYL